MIIHHTNWIIISYIIIDFGSWFLFCTLSRWIFTVTSHEMQQSIWWIGIVAEKKNENSPNGMKFSVLNICVTWNENYKEPNRIWIYCWEEGVSSQATHMFMNVQNTLEPNICRSTRKRKCYGWLWAMMQNLVIYFQPVNDTSGIQNGYDHREKKSSRKKTKQLPKIHSILHHFRSVRVRTWIGSFFLFMNALNDWMRSVWWMDCAHVYKTPFNWKNFVCVLGSKIK